MKIAYVYDAVYPWIKGGAEKRIYELSRRLVERGHEVHCYGMKMWPGQEDILQDGVHLHGICRPVPLYSGSKRSMKEAVYFAGRVLSSLPRDFDLVDCQEFPYLPCFSARLRTFRGPLLFITWYEVWGDYWYEYLGRKGLLGKAVERAVSRLTDKNIADSERTRRDLETLGVREVQVVPNGIDFEGIQRLRASDEGSDVIFVGRLLEHKNADLLIRAVAMASREIPDIRAVIIGDGPERENLRSLARSLDLEKNIKFTGFLEDYDQAVALMKSSRIFASPSTREGFGIAALEANACGLPIVTSRHSMNAVCDLVTADTGLICEPCAEDLAKGILEGLNWGEGRREKCIERARSFDWEEIVCQAEKIYELGLSQA